MANAIDIIREKLNLTIEKKLSQNVMTKIKKELGNLLDLFMRERLDKGVDRQGKKIKPLKASYNRWKREYIAGTLRHRKKTLQNKPLWYRKLYDTTQYKAKNVPNYGRLTGKSLMSLNPEIKGISLKGNKIEFIAELQTLASGKTRTPIETQKIISGLKARGRDYYGMLASPTTNIGKRERERIIQMIKKVARL